uniref:Uncharacterized protein n=1 Tax=viral metagenome TaxID=1070528 RepID=A0A6H2A2M9_9ZZZZ
MKNISSIVDLYLDREIIVTDNDLDKCGAMINHYDVMLKWTSTSLTNIQKNVCNEFFNSSGECRCQDINDNKITYQCPFFKEENGQFICLADEFVINKPEDFNDIIKERLIIK